MLSQFVGLLLLGLGVKTTPYANPNVKGDSTEATQTMTPAPTNGTSDTNTQYKKTDTRPRILPVLSKDRIATRPGDTKEIARMETKQLHEEVVKGRQDFLEEVKAKREAAQAEFRVKQEAFKEKLAQIKDERKKALVEKLSERCQEINKKRTDTMTAMLTKFSTILENITNRAATAKTNGKDTTSVDTAVASAQTAITSAQTAVAAQAAGECVITINSESTLRTDVGAAISSLEKDMKVAYDAVLAARKAVGNAVKALGLVLGESLTAKVTPTAAP